MVHSRRKAQANPASHPAIDDEARRTREALVGLLDLMATMVAERLLQDQVAEGKRRGRKKEKG